MPNSFALPTDDLQCSKCHQTFTVDIWYIIDTQERPDLLTQLQAGNIHKLSCPHCHTEFGTIDAPSLIYRPDREPHILFVLSEQLSQEQNQKMAAGLLDNLRQQLGFTWEDKLFANGYLMLPRSMLVVALSDDPKETFGQNDPGVGRDVNTTTQQKQGDELLLQAFGEFVDGTWSESRDYLQLHQELLSDEADDLIASTAALARMMGDEDAYREFTIYRNLLHRCREIGIVSAFTEGPTKYPKDNMTIPPHFKESIEQVTQIEQSQAEKDQVLLDQTVLAWERILEDSSFPSMAKSFQRVVMNDAGNAFLRRYSVQKRLSDLSRALQLWQEALQQTPFDSPKHAQILANLGKGLLERYNFTHEPADLDATVTAYQEALQQAPFDSPERARILTNLGNGLLERYNFTHEPADLDASVTAYQEALQYISTDSPDRANYLNVLGVGLRRRYILTGQIADLDASVTAYQEALQQTKFDSPMRAVIFNNLGNSLGDRYARTGQLIDLDASIAANQEAVEQITSDSPDRASSIFNLGAGLRERYLQTRQLVDLEAAIDAVQDAVEHTQPDAPNRAMHLNGLGAVLIDRYARIGQSADLEAAINAFQEAVKCTQSDIVDYARNLNSLGAGLRERYLQTRQLVDLEAAIDAFQESVQYTPHNAPIRAMHLNGLGVALHDRYDHIGQPTDLDKATIVFREACQEGLVLQKAEALTAAINWGHGAMTRHNWIEAKEAFQYGIDALEQLYRAQLLLQSRQSWQKKSGNLIVMAAYSQARTGHLIHAVLTLEQGRTRQLNELLARDRAQLEDLAQQQPQLAEQYQQLTNQLRQLESTERLQMPYYRKETPNWAQHRQQLHVVATQFDTLIEQIRLVSGYETFLLPISWNNLQAILQPDVPFLYLLTTEVGSLGLLVQAVPDHQEAVTPIWLDNFTENDLNSFLIKRTDDVVGGYIPGQLGQWRWLRKALRDEFPRLGASLLTPIAEHLHRLGIKKLVIIPTGRLNLLPLHAAPYAMDGRTEIFGDDFCVTYAPSGQSVAYSFGHLANQPTMFPTLLSVGDPQPVTAKPLVFARHEASEIMKYFPEKGNLLLTADATLEAVKQNLKQANYIHLACHGLFDPKAPMQSGLLFSHDELLTLSDLMNELYPMTARLIILSACQTAISDFNELPDEMIGLPAGLLLTGVPGVIGTLWPVNDHSTALLMLRFYRYHMEEGLTPAEALQKAQYWLRNATREEIGNYYKSFIRISAVEASSLHWEIRKEGKPNDQPYAHPFYWAAFAFYGV